MRFPIAVHKDEGSVYGVTVPDVPGCFSSGATFDEALDSAKEAITSHLETLLELGDRFDVTPGSIENHINNPDYAGAVWAVVDIDAASLDATPARVNISMPRFVLSKIDLYAESRGETRSGFLMRAALEAIQKP